MSSPKLKPLTIQQVVELWSLFGPPPVLSSEDKQAYEILCTAYVSHYRLSTIMHVQWIRELVDTKWENFRWMRNRTQGIERYFRKRNAKSIDRLEAQKTHLKSEVEITEARQALRYVDAKITELSNRRPDADDHNQAMEECIEFLEKLDRFHNNGTVRGNNLENLLEYHCSPYDNSSVAIEAERNTIHQEPVAQIDAPPLSPAAVTVTDGSEAIEAKHNTVHQEPVA